MIRPGIASKLSMQLTRKDINVRLVLVLCNSKRAIQLVLKVGGSWW